MFEKSPKGRARSKVVDAGYGQVALHQAASNRFVKMSNHEPCLQEGPDALECAEAVALILRVRELVRLRPFEGECVRCHGRVALHNSIKNRFVSMCHHGDGCRSPHRDPDALPGGWTWQMFHVLEIKPCHTGGGGHCKTCQNPWHRHVDNHCASCNPGYYRHGHHCHAYGCTGGRDRICGSCVAQHHRRQHDHCGSCNGGHSLRGRRCQSKLLGATVGLHQPNHNRFVNMWGHDLVWTGHRNWDSLPSGWTSTFFRVHFAGDAKIGLHNPRENRWIRLRNNNDMDGAPARHSWETFTAVDAGSGKVALHCRAHNKYMRMPNRHHMDTSPHRNAWDLPWNWGWERFRPMSALLRHGTVVALWNEPHHRFMRMNAHNGHMDGSPSKHLHHFPSGWSWEPFRVVDAGYGQVALHNAANNRFVKMGHDMIRSPGRNWNDLPGGWGAERFTVVDAGHGRVALHHADHNRFVSMCHHGDGCLSPHKAPDHLPGGWTWQMPQRDWVEEGGAKWSEVEWGRGRGRQGEEEEEEEEEVEEAEEVEEPQTSLRQMFHVLEACDVWRDVRRARCQLQTHSPFFNMRRWQAKVHNHCATCNPGYYMHGHHCKAEPLLDKRMPQTRHPEHPRNSQDVLASSPCQSRLLGATVGLHQGNHNRFVNMPLGLAKDPEDLSCWSKDCSSAFAGSPCDRGRGSASLWLVVDLLPRPLRGSSSRGSLMCEGLDMSEKPSESFNASFVQDSRISVPALQVCPVFALHMGGGMRGPFTRCLGRGSTATAYLLAAGIQLCGLTVASRYDSAPREADLPPSSLLAQRLPRHQPRYCQHFWPLQSSKIDDSYEMDMDGAGARHSWETFTAVDAGGGKVALHCRAHNKYMRMPNGHHMDTSPHRNAWDLPGNWGWERFRPVSALLRPGTTVALWNDIHKRYMRMNGHHDKMDGSPKLNNMNDFPAGWSWEPFRVVDAGYGQVALHNAASNRFIKMPSGWGAEKYTVVDAGHGRIALHHAEHNRSLDAPDSEGKREASDQIQLCENGKGTVNVSDIKVHTGVIGSFTADVMDTEERRTGRVRSKVANLAVLRPAAASSLGPLQGALKSPWYRAESLPPGSGPPARWLDLARQMFHVLEARDMAQRDAPVGTWRKTPDAKSLRIVQVHDLTLSHPLIASIGRMRSQIQAKVAFRVKSEIGALLGDHALRHRRRRQLQNVHNHCATCNPGYYMHGHHCKAYSCTGGRDRICHACVAQHDRRQNDHCGSCDGGHVMRGRRCQSRLLGATVALHQANHGRFVNMPLGLAKDAEDLRKTLRTCRVAPAGFADFAHGELACAPEDQLPSGWSSTFFRVHFAGDAKIGLHNPRENRWIRLRNNNDMDGAPARNSWETFTAVDAGHGQVALHCRAHNKYMRMPNGHHMDTSPARNAWDLPSNWGWERFRPVSALLRPGTTVALWNDIHKRYMRMNGHHDKMDGSPKLNNMNEYPSGWSWEPFRVVDAGYGQVALHNAASNRFIKMSSKMHRSPTKNWNQLPTGWGAEKYTVVDAGHGRIALHHADHNRFVSMCHHGASCLSPHKAPDQLPGGWTWQMFHVLEIMPCSTGGGASCKTCQNPANRKVHNHCATCNNGYYLHGKHCKAYSCTSGRDRICKSCVAQHDRRQNDHCGSCDGGHVMRGRRCQSRLLGATVALHQENHGRFVNMWGHDMVWTSKKNSDQLPSGWSSTFFRVHFAGDAKIGLHNPRENKWIRLRDNNDMDGAGARHSWETFTAVDAGSGKVALHCRAHNKYMRMPNGHHMDTSPARNAWDLPSNWGWERFRPVSALLRPGTTVALWNDIHKRFMRMNGHHDKMDGSPKLNNMNEYPSRWSWEPFRVVDAGYGQVALHNAASNRFIKMSSKMHRSPTKNWNQLPTGWGAEKYTVVDAGHGRIALHHADHNRFVSMCKNGDSCLSPHKAPDHLPGDWTWQMFHVLEITPCSTGGGGSCKTCQNPANRKVHNHCATCNNGYYLHGNHCKAYSCTTGRNRLCKSCVAQGDRRQNDHCGSCDGGLVLRGKRCQSLLLGATVAFHQANHGRFVKMRGNNLEWTGKKSSDGLPADWASTFFRVHFAGDAKIGLHNPRANKWIRLRDNKDMDGADHRKSWETFTTVDAGSGKVALHCAAHNKYMRMPNAANMDTSPARNAWDLPSNWGWERFRPVSALLRPGTTVALWNAIHKRYMRMNGHHDIMDGSPKLNDWKEYPSRWSWEPFRVVDAGYGQVALHNAASNRFIKMGGDMIRSPTKNVNDLPGGWGAERFTVVDAGGGRVALHHAVHNRFVSMCDNGDGCVSPHKAPDHLPDTWTWQMFHVLEIKPCSTGGGSNCKTCKDPHYREVTNHCASCNAGHFMDGKRCKEQVYKCETGSGGKCKTCKVPGQRQAENHCASCNAGWELKDKTCKAVACPANSAGTNVGAGCSCNAGYSGTIAAASSSPFYSGSCSAVACPYGSAGTNVPSGCSCFSGYEGAVTATTGSPFYTYNCKSLLVGATIALHGTSHNRFVRMNGENMDRTAAKASDKLPSTWDTTFFRIVDAGAGKIGLYNPKNKKYIRMNKEDMDAVGWRRSWESFSVVDAGKGEVALHSETFNRFIRMRDSANMDASGKSKSLPSGWTWERFKVVQVLLKPGSEIALHNSIFNRFMRMHGDANKMDSSAEKNINALPDGWTWERFKVVDAGFGQVALHSAIHNRFVRMWKSDMDRSGQKDASALPTGWWAERFTVVDCGGGKAGTREF
ncbi:unnamed protein product [Symbiodinium natans]|uniref:EGF-like domain-containing protein n=1 Tax=Symbiodinium natans TaxID=878477 RepID=A0A812SHI5_9DINO|nr:unnamed protein product [Symbiodinium natans]